jgi:hypothetical protein
VAVEGVLTAAPPVASPAPPALPPGDGGPGDAAAAGWRGADARGVAQLLAGAARCVLAALEGDGGKGVGRCARGTAKAAMRRAWVHGPQRAVRGA